MNHDSAAEIRSTLETLGLSLKKRWGQNFLVNRGARERIVALLGIETGETVWEIGPGLGSMTELLARSASALTVFEVDRGLCRWLEESMGGRPGVRIVPGDFIETWTGERDAHGAPDRVLGNLPYRSASLMIGDMVEGGLRPRRAVFTVQRELAERLVAGTGEKNYSSFTVLCRACFRIEHRGDLKPGSFYPAPEVVSSIIDMRPRPDAPRGEALVVLSALARGLFAARRKTLRNNVTALTALEPLRVLAALETAGIDPGRRAEELDPDTWTALARDLTRSAAP
jgi:16S rRNA (adenine1518-N6/adenine1519-N6)-dimethyltransferase